ncbi:MAG: hypothetical protein NTU41_01475 [Chloroflexi bacterium]|nr:hypothetical protein [Chloroflexota bacterium]
MGLGLGITKGLIEQNAGAVELASEVGQGTTFTVRLPVMASGEMAKCAP